MIETSRLILRAWCAEDLSALGAILGDAEVMAFSDHGAMRPDAQREWLRDAMETRDKTELPGRLAVEHKADGEVIGYVSLSRDALRVALDEAELGFRLTRRSWGRGYASEAATALISAARGQPGLSRVVAIVDPHNVRSVRVVTRIGMAYVKDIWFEGYDHADHVYGLDLKVAPSSVQLR